MWIDSDGPPEFFPLSEPSVPGGSHGESRPLTPSAIRERQAAKISEIKHALAAAGVHTLDQQAERLGLSRSTAWHLLSGKHKGSGLSATIINRMLVAPRLPPHVRSTVLEYVAEKVSGRYGDNKLRVNRFTARLAGGALNRARVTRRETPRASSAKFR